AFFLGGLGLLLLFSRPLLLLPPGVVLIGSVIAATTFWIALGPICSAYPFLGFRWLGSVYDCVLFSPAFCVDLLLLGVIVFLRVHQTKENRKLATTRTDPLAR